MTGDSELKAILGQAPNVGGQLWDCLITDPTAGVIVISRGFEVLYANPTTAWTYGGPQATPADYIGRSVDACGLDPAYVAERRAFCAAVLGDGRPRLVRSIWRGRQILLWYTPMGRADDGRPDRVLAIGRQLPGIGLTDTLAGFPIPLIFADAVELGELNRLTTRELEVLALIGAGKTIKEAGAELNRSPKTVEKHRLAAGRKLGLHDRAQLIDVAHRAGLLVSDAGRTRIELRGTPGGGGVKQGQAIY